MLKRILSGVLAAVLLVTTIPFTTANAADTIDEGLMVAGWMSSLFTKCYNADSSNDDIFSNYTGGIDDSGKVTYGMGLISMPTCNRNVVLTLCPIHTTNKSYTFEHADTVFEPANNISSNGTPDNLFKESIAFDGSDGLRIGSSYTNGLFVNPNATTSPRFRYGTIGAMIVKNLYSSLSNGSEKKLVINPVYTWNDLTIDGTGYKEMHEVYESQSVNTTYVYAFSPVDETETKSIISTYWVDPLSVYAFIAKIHLLYHNKNVWAGLDSINYNGTSMSGSEAYDKLFKNSADTCDSECQLITSMHMLATKGTINCSDGREDDVLSAAVLNRENRTDSSVSGESADFDITLNFTFYRMYLSDVFNQQYQTCGADITSLMENNSSALQVDEVNKIAGANVVEHMSGFKSWVKNLVDETTYNDKHFAYSYLNTFLVSSGLGFTDVQKDYPKFNELILRETARVMCPRTNGIRNTGPWVTSLAGEWSLMSRDGSNTVGSYIKGAFNDFLSSIQDIRDAKEQSAIDASRVLVSNTLSGSFTIGNYTVTALTRALIPSVFGYTESSSNKFDDLEGVLKMQYPNGQNYGNKECLVNPTYLKNKGSIVEGVAKAMNTSTYEEFLEEFMPLQTWTDLHNKSATIWDGHNKAYSDFISAYPVTGSQYKKSRDDFVGMVIYDAILACYDESVNDIRIQQKMLFLHTVWNKMYATDKDGVSNLYFCSSDTPNWANNLKSNWTNTSESSVTMTAAAAIDQYKAQYDIVNKVTTTSMPGAETLKLRSDIIDFYAKYNLPKDDFLEEILGKCTDIYKEIQGDVLFMNSLGNDYLCYEPMNYDKAGELYVYQQELVYEATYYGDMVYISLILDVLSDGVTLEGNGKYINLLSDLKAIHDKYRGSASDGFWYKGGQSDVAVEEKGASFRDESQKSQLDTLAGLYDYLVALGMISSGDYTLDIYDEQDPITLFWTQTNGNITFSKDYYKGRALSATYIPMQTNAYDPYSMLDYVDTDWIEDFHYKYGFYRKALLIDTNVDAAVDSYVSNTQGTTRIATLGDLFNCESDIVLYIDEHFYGLTELAELQNKTYDRLASTNPGLWDKLKNSISDMFSMFREVDFDVALKQKVSTYSDRIQENVSGMDFKLETDDEGNVITELKPYDQYILTPDAIKQYIASDEYTPMLGYAVVSNIYRNRDAFVTVHNVGVTRTPVFESSPTLSTIAGSSDDAKNTIYNYALLKNISAMTTVGYETSTDMSSPIYCDIYGNIVTESGLVVVPAACNATLHRGDSQWQPISTGFLSTYGKEWSIPTSWNLDEEFMTGMFYKNEDLGVWEIRNKTIQGMEINFAQLSYADKNVNVALKEWYNYDLVNGSEINQYNSLNILHEVLRGAPLENIDFDAENLNSARKVDKSGLIAAAKLDNIVNSLDWDDENSIMSVPRLSFIDNYQYVVVFIFKILLVIIVTALMITIYVDVLKTKISWRTVGRCVLTLVLGVTSVLLIPISYDISYYQSNKLLLQDEAEYIMMLNTEKNMSGREIGVYEVTEPEQHTQIMIKLEDFEFNWLSELPNVITSDSINVMSDKYQEFLNSSLLANKDNVQAMNDGMYMDIQDIFDTSVLNFSTTSKQLYQKVSVDPVASYYIPYYYFLDALLTNMNDFNRVNNVYAYSTKIMRGGAVKTVNLCDAYFNSKDFMESTDSDFLGLYQLYDTMGSMIILPIFNEDSITGARQSQWFVGTLMSEDDVLDRLELMTNKVREFVMKNKSLIGKVTDETFLKCMAMDLAIEYNNIFGIPSANAFEVYNLSNTDLMRLTIADKASTLEGSPMSFSRFVYNEAGTPGVYASVFLVITTMFVQTMKTVITIAIMVLLIVSVFVFKILLRKSNQSIAGYLLTLLVICSTNILYAIILKISLAIPQTGLAPTLCIIIQIIVQLAYLFVLAVVLGFALRDWKNIGFTHYEAIGQKIKEKFSRHRSRTPRDRYDSQPRGVDGWDYYRQLVKENERRMKKVGTH